MVVPSSRGPIRSPSPTPAQAQAQEPGQAQYEVRFDWGLEGLAHVADGVGVIVIADALPPVNAGAGEDVSDGGASAGSAHRSPDALSHGLLAASFGVPVVAATLRNRSAVARWILARQEGAGKGIRVAVIAAGEQRADGSARFAVEDLLVAGALVDALAGVGVDYCPPEAAAACAAYTGLARATRHLLSASETGVALRNRNEQEHIARAGELDVCQEVPVLVEVFFRPAESFGSA